MFKRSPLIVVMVGICLLSCATFLYAAEADLQKQIDEIKGVTPKFAVPMREVGGRFQNMYFAAKGGNWGLAAYMSKYMNGAMAPASLTKPDDKASPFKEPGEAMQALQTSAQYTDSTALSINRRGQIVGSPPSVALHMPIPRSGPGQLPQLPSV